MPVERRHFTDGRARSEHVLLVMPKGALRGREGGPDPGTVTSGPTTRYRHAEEPGDR